MTKVNFVLLGLVFFCIRVSAVKPPEAVLKAFGEKYSTAEKIRWSKENTHEYEAEFMIKGVNYSANFSDTRLWLETESALTFDSLPEKVQKSFNDTHKNTVIKAISKIETSRGSIKYEIEVKKGGRTIELFYTLDGTATHE